MAQTAYEFLQRMQQTATKDAEDSRAKLEEKIFGKPLTPGEEFALDRLVAGRPLRGRGSNLSFEDTRAYHDSDLSTKY